MSRPRYLYANLASQFVDEIVWGPNLTDLVDSLKSQSKLVRFSLRHCGEMWVRIHMIAAATRQNDPDQRSGWYMNGHYKGLDDEEKTCTIDYDSDTGEGWIRLESYYRSASS